MKRHLTTDRNGQAIVEFLVALVAVLALFLGLVQLSSLTKARTDTMEKARMKAGWIAVTPGSINGETPLFVDSVLEGSDAKRYSADDKLQEATLDDQTRFHNLFLTPSAGGSWSTIDSVNNNLFSALNNAPAPAEEFGLVSAKESTTVPLWLGVQHLLYSAPEIKVESKVWMVRTKDIY